MGRQLELDAWGGGEGSNKVDGVFTFFGLQNFMKDTSSAISFARGSSKWASALAEGCPAFWV